MMVTAKYFPVPPRRSRFVALQHFRFESQIAFVGILTCLLLNGCTCSSQAPPAPRIVCDHSCYAPLSHDASTPLHIPAEPIVLPEDDRGEASELENGEEEDIDQTAYWSSGPVTLSPQSPADVLPQPIPEEAAQLAELEALARTNNPRLQRLAQEAQAARARVAYVDRLPDPAVGVNGFAAPIETAAGSQRANLTLSQMLPWLARLDAQARQACFEAMALEQSRAAEELKVLADLNVAWYRLYVIRKQIEINQANQDVLQRLINVATSRVETDQASQGDVLAGSVEFSRLEESRLVLEQRLSSTQAEIERIVGHPISAPLGPEEIADRLPSVSLADVQQLAYQFQPDIEAAETLLEASRWGIEVARLRRRPDFTLNATWFSIDGNRPPSAVVDVGQDAWSVGAMVSLPIDRCKYDALAEEASWKYSASQSNVEETKQRYDFLIRDLWEQASAAASTAQLYEDAILPQANQALDTDLLSYSNGDVEFDRVLQDFRNVLQLESSYHQSLGQLAGSLARLEQAAGTRLAEWVE